MTRSSHRKKKSASWHQTQNRDGFVREANRLGLRSRSYFKLEELNRKFGIVKQGMSVLDLGAVPGGWSQYASRVVGKNGQVFAVDLLDMKPLPNVQFLQLDITTENATDQIQSVLRNSSVDAVISDMAPNITGITSTDALNFENLQKPMFKICTSVLRKGGNLVFKAFKNTESVELKQKCLLQFEQCEFFKPKASRARSSEFYVSAKKLKNPEQIL